MKTNEINTRDPYIVFHEGKYYMYGALGKSAFGVYISEDLESWTAPKTVFSANDEFWGKYDFWAPEVHLYKGKFYMFASVKSDTERRATVILVSDRPDGEFMVHNDHPTPRDWECLDGTLYVEDGVPYMVFCHEWVQVRNGEVCAIELSEDLKHSVGEAWLLWKATDAKWVCPTMAEDIYVTDAPFLYKSEDGKLKSLWSSFSEGKYVLGTATSDNGSIKGNWTVDDELIFKENGGHGMIFENAEGKKLISIHCPNLPIGSERPKFIEF